ncbi:MAG: helix-turn-helix domain-containing protein [Pseudomonadota bacterium]
MDLRPEAEETSRGVSRSQKSVRASDRKWGREVMNLGFCVLPSLLMRAQNRLGLNPTQLALLLQLADFWWEEDRKPFPSKKVLSTRLGISERQVQRYARELEQAGFLKRVQRYAPHGGKQTNTYDLAGLVAKLKDLEPEFREVKEETKSQNTSVQRRGYRTNKAATQNSKS